MPFVKVKENEPFDVALRRFKRSCEKAGILAEVRRREYTKAHGRARKAAAVKRHAKKLQREAKRMERLLAEQDPGAAPNTGRPEPGGRIRPGCGGQRYRCVCPRDFHPRTAPVHVGIQHNDTACPFAGRGQERHARS